LSTFERGLELVLRAEGGYVDDPDDAGGATNYGITQKTFDGWNELRGSRSRPVKEITKIEVAAIYRESYWKAGRCDELPERLAIAHFDAMVNHRPTDAAKVLQRALGVIPDGIIGPKTIAAARVSGPEVLENWYWHRARLYCDLVETRPVNVKFLRGWILRTLRLRGSLQT